MIGFFVLRLEFRDVAAGHLGLHLVEGLHDLDQADGVTFGDVVTVCLERRVIGRGLAVKGAR
jgi:hypothetical protein